MSDYVMALLAVTIIVTSTVYIALALKIKMSQRTPRMYNKHAVKHTDKDNT